MKGKWTLLVVAHSQKGWNETEKKGQERKCCGDFWTMKKEFRDLKSR